MLLGFVALTGVAGASECSAPSATHPWGGSPLVYGYGSADCESIEHYGTHELRVDLIRERFGPDDTVDTRIDSQADTNGDFAAYVQGCRSGTNDYKTVASLSAHGQTTTGWKTLSC